MMNRNKTTNQRRQDTNMGNGMNHKKGLMVKKTGFSLLSASLLFSFGVLGHSAQAAIQTTVVTDAVGNQETWMFDENQSVYNLRSRISNVDGKGITQTFDPRNNLLTRTDEKNRVTKYTYNLTNQLTSKTEAFDTWKARTTTYQYVDEFLNLPTFVTEPSVSAGLDKITTTDYDPDLNVNFITIDGYKPDGTAISRTTTFDYNDFGQVNFIDGPRTDVADVTNLYYNECNSGGGCGQLSYTVNALGHTTTYDSYDGNGRLTQMTDANGVVTTYDYFPRGWIKKITQNPAPGGGATRITHYTYDGVGQVKTTTLPDGMVLTYEYDAAHDLRSVTDNLGNKVEYSYDLKGNRTQVKTRNPNNSVARSVTTAYDIRNRVKNINAAGSLTKTIRDAVGNLVTETDPKQNPSTAHKYDPLHRLDETIDALSNSTQYDYDVQDNLTQVIAPNGATTAYVYDDLGNMLSEDSPDRGLRTYTHDDAGNVTSITDARGVTVSYTYDELNRIKKANYPGTAEDITYTYDNCARGIGRLCRMFDEGGKTYLAYNGFGDTTYHRRNELGINYVTKYSVDKRSRITKITYPNGRIVNYNRDAIGRIDHVTTDVNGTITDVLSNRSFRADGLATDQTYGNGLTETRTYDKQGRLTSQQLGSIETIDYDYDPNSNLVELDKVNEGRLYDYDELDRLISDLKAQTSDTIANYTYEYDANGNREKRNGLTNTYIPNSNLLDQYGSTAITHDAAGNRLTYYGGRSYTYNQAGRLHEYLLNGVVKSTYFYNALGQRSRKDNPNVAQPHVYHYDLQGNLIGESTADGKWFRDYIWVDNAPLTRNKVTSNSDGSINTETERLYLITDHLNTPRIGTDATQTIVWRWDADAFGIKIPNRDPDADGTDTTMFLRFPGQFYDSESGLYYNWNRYYDRLTGRYITSDPIGLEGGLNTYGYVGGNPGRFIDPTGEGIITIAIITGLIVSGIVFYILGPNCQELIENCRKKFPKYQTDDEDRRGYLTCVAAAVGISGNIAAIISGPTGTAATGIGQTIGCGGQCEN